MKLGEAMALQFVRAGEGFATLTTTERKQEQQAVVWDLSSGNASTPFTVPMGTRNGGQQAVDFSEDGLSLAIGVTLGEVKVFDIPSGKERLVVKKHQAPGKDPVWSEVCAVKFVNDDRNVLSAGRDSQQFVWDAKTGKDVTVLKGHKVMGGSSGDLARRKTSGYRRSRFAHSLVEHRDVATGYSAERAVLPLSGDWKYRETASTRPVELATALMCGKSHRARRC